jgi:hypothetical protein
VLDAHEVEHYEGAAAMEVLEQEDSYLAMMLHNACMAHKMVCGCGFMCECECGFGCIGMSVGVGVWVHVRMDRLITHTNCSQTHTLQQLHLHRELFGVMYGRRSRAVVKGAPLTIPINPTRKMEMWDYEGSLSLPVSRDDDLTCASV